MEMVRGVVAGQQVQVGGGGLPGVGAVQRVR